MQHWQNDARDFDVVLQTAVQAFPQCNIFTLFGAGIIMLHLQCHLLCNAGWVTEGEGAFSEMSGSPPKNIHQEALRGIAKVCWDFWLQTRLLHHAVRSLMRPWC